MVVALITAGGKGTRFKNETPKQFIDIYGKPLIIYTLELFQNNKNIDKIIISCLDEWKNYMLELKEKYNISKLEWIAKNGTTQPESINNCLNLLKDNISNNDIVVIHAGNRPLVSDNIINNSINECIDKGNAITFIPCPEVLVSQKKEIIKRESILRIQTPQTFKYDELIKMYKEAEKNKIFDIATTCDLMIKLGKNNINYIEGSPINIKITYPEDIIMFKALLKELKKVKK